MNTQELLYKNVEFSIDTYWLDPIADFTSEVKRPLVVIFPGGGFTFHSDREAQPIALKFAAAGVHAIVLHYKLIDDGNPVYPLALQETAATLNWIHSQAEAHQIDLDKVFLIGFSAGGHIVANYNSLMTNPDTYEEIYGEPISVDPCAIILSYSVVDLTMGYPEDVDYATEISPEIFYWQSQEHLTKYAKPTFIWQTVSDETVPVMNSIVYAQKMDLLNLPYELHLFATGRHGLALSNHVTEDPGESSYVNYADSKWWSMCLNWLKLQKVLPK